MKNHTKVYMKYFNFKIQQDCFCEICDSYAQDIHHIDARGMGGSSDKDDIKNLMALCRKHHILYGDVPDKKEWLLEIHLKFMNRK